MYSECPQIFHPNRLTSDEVIAERVNTVKTRHKVNPILGEAIASRRKLYDIFVDICHMSNILVSIRTSFSAVITVLLRIY